MQPSARCSTEFLRNHRVITRVSQQMRFYLINASLIQFLQFALNELVHSVQSLLSTRSLVVYHVASRLLQKSPKILILSSSVWIS